MNDALLNHEIEMACAELISQADIVEEVRLLADSMSTHEALAEKMNISSQYLSDVLQGRRNPGPKIQKFLGVKRVIMYQEIK